MMPLWRPLVSLFYSDELWHDTQNSQNLCVTQSENILKLSAWAIIETFYQQAILWKPL